MIVSMVTITRVLEGESDDRVYIEAVDGQGAVLPVVEFLGLVELAKDTFMWENSRVVTEEDE